jgi:hypothetical protein
MSKIISLQELLETTSNITNDEAYALKHAKSPRSIRIKQNAYDTWKSINHHLQTLKRITEIDTHPNLSSTYIREQLLDLLKDTNTIIIEKES